MNDAQIWTFGILAFIVLIALIGRLYTPVPPWDAMDSGKRKQEEPNEQPTTAQQELAENLIQVREDIAQIKRHLATLEQHIREVAR